MNLQKLNQTEEEVLVSLYNQTMDCTSGEFGYVGDAEKCGLTKHQFAGYIGSLTQKGAFDYLDTDYSTTYGGQYALTEEAEELAIELSNKVKAA